MLFVSILNLHAQDDVTITNPDLRDTMMVLLSLDVGAERFKQELTVLKDSKMRSFIDSLFSLPSREKRKYAVKKFITIISKNGLPTKEEIGSGRPYEALLVLTTHAADAPFMKAQLPLLKENFAPQSIAVLEDKICVLENLPQIYGSQAIFSTEENRPIFYKIEDPNQVDQRRLEVGLSSLEEYAKEIGVDWEKEKTFYIK